MTIIKVSGILMVCGYKISFYPEILGSQFRAVPQLLLKLFCTNLSDYGTPNIIAILSMH
jgi:hypothetical protein